MTGLQAKLLLVGASALLGSFVADQGLRLVGVPTELPGRVAHPPGLSELRQNLEFQYHFATNSQGLRYREIPLQKPAGTHRVIVLGDSYTEGWGVSSSDTYVARLEQCFGGQDRDVLFVNGGLSNTGPREYEQLLLNVGMQYQPDGVLIGIFANDLTDTPISLEAAPRRGVSWLAHSLWPRIHTVLRRTKQLYEDRQLAIPVHRIRVFPGHRLASDAPPSPDQFVALVSDHAAQLGIPQARIRAWQLRLPSALVLAATNGEFNASILTMGLLRTAYWTDNLDIDSDSANARWWSMSSILSAIVQDVRSKELAIGVVFIPTPVQYNRDNQEIWARVGVTIRKAWLSGESELQKRLRIWAERERVPFLDLTPTLRSAVKTPPQLTYKLDGHWTPYGHRVASKAIGDWLVKESVFPFISVTKSGRPPFGAPRSNTRTATAKSWCGLRSSTGSSTASRCETC